MSPHVATATNYESDDGPDPHFQMSRALSQRLLSIAEGWSKDPFRPNIQLSAFLRSLSLHPRLTKRAVEDSRILHDHEMMKKVISSPYPTNDVLKWAHSTIIVSVISEDVTSGFAATLL